MRSVWFMFPVLLAGALIFQNCREKAVGVAYVVGDRLPVYAKPDRFLQPATVLKKDARLDILETKVPDPRAPKRAFWYRIRAEKVEGYVSYDEELQRGNLASFTPTAGKQDGLITASSLRLREDPTLKAKVITSLPRRTVVNVIMQGSLRQKIGKKEDIWVKVRTPDGKEGFCFAGYLHRGNPEQIKNLAEAEFELIEGFIFAKAESPAYLTEPGGRPVTEEDPVNGGYHDVNRYPRAKKDSLRYAAVVAKQKHEGVVWYHVQQTNCDYMECTGLNAWVSGKDVEFLTDFFEHTMARAGKDRNVPLLREVQSALEEGVVLDAGRTEYQEITLFQATGTGAADTAPESAAMEATAQEGQAQPPEARAIPTATTEPEPVRYYMVDAHVGTSMATRSILVAATGNRYRSLGTFDSPTVRDLDGDGNMELITDESERADTTYSVYSYSDADKSFKKILHFSAFSPMEFIDPYIVFNPEGDEMLDTKVAPFDTKFAKAKQRALFLENGAYREVAFAEVPEELRAKLQYKPE